ncbi:MAG: SCO family protein [Burkholderiales bacterium]|nr:MAG: SCO family protein [Burkholderiales bacterium]
MGPATSAQIRTLVCCLLVLAAFFAVVYKLTSNFEYWTFEALRRQSAQHGELQMSAIQLRDQDARQFPLLESSPPEGQIYLVDFFYASCPSVCQSLGSEYFQIQEQLKASGRGNIRLISISIDPSHDDPLGLKNYAGRHRADAQVWKVAAPVSPEQGRALMRRLGVVAVPDGLGGYVHNGAIHVVDRHGQVRQVLDFADWQTALRTAVTLADGEQR